MGRTSRSHAPHDHKHGDHGATGHAGRITSRKVGQSHFLMAMDNTQGGETGLTPPAPQFAAQIREKHADLSFTDALGNRNFPHLQWMAVPVAGGWDGRHARRA